MFSDWFRVIIKRTDVPENVLENVPENRLEKIIEIIKNNQHITIQELSTIFNVHQKTIKRDIAKLKEEQRIKRIGPDKGGYWKILT